MSQSQLLRRDIRAQLRRPTRRWPRRVMTVILVIVLGAVLAMMLRGFVMRQFYIPSESMEPTLHVNDRITVDVIGPSVTGFERGDVVVFADPGGWVQDEPYDPTLAQQMGLVPEGGSYIVKRIIGMPGDTVEGLSDGTVFVNGEQVRVPAAVVGLQTPFETTLGAGEVWVMGDNRVDSADSRFHGPVPEDSLVGTVAFVE